MMKIPKAEGLLDQMLIRCGTQCMDDENDLCFMRTPENLPSSTSNGRSVTIFLTYTSRYLQLEIPNRNNHTHVYTIKCRIINIPTML